MGGLALDAGAAAWMTRVVSASAVSRSPRSQDTTIVVGDVAS